MKTVVTIEGMSCEHCAMRVKKALEALPGVDQVSVSLASSTAELSGAGLDNESIAKAVEKVGYKASAVS
ncbi:MAG TPA: heavy-metal-associated domain-containing protein [Spirochaetales bacterium]|nr:heavy-metal-associated domain-containing protein [Spirochaetales bacterium]